MDAHTIYMLLNLKLWKNCYNHPQVAKNQKIEQKQIK